MKGLGPKFWMGWNSFVLLFLAVNICTIGVETRSRLPFLLGLGYLVYMSIYLSKAARWKTPLLVAIAAIGIIIYGVALLAGRIGPNLRPLAGAHLGLSCVLLAGALLHLSSGRIARREKD